ncbi:hypothetical protein [Methanolacinia paynteri]|uniref:hypothetical protein n=1 Tax=Methanolacinia paynteri TaxID=230356 RepID=UPI0012F6343B|nr:hypothetical protein [Methanolacinia paynteri]
MTVLLTGISQVLLKTGSLKGRADNRLFGEYLNIYTLSAYAILLLVTVISVIAMIEVPLKLFYAIASLNFVVVTLLSWILLKEEVNGWIITGVVVIVAGIVIFNL